MWPIIVRELRLASRGQTTYWLRALGAGAACGAALLAGLLTLGTPSQSKSIFAALHLALFGAIWLFVPLVAADCLSRERREGTLGLLFLTPLKPLHITIAKTLTQSLRAFTLWLATVPIVVIPMLIGGVTFTEAVLSILINAASFCWALGAGIWVSSRSTEFHRSVMGTMGMALAFFVVFCVLNCLLGILAFSAGRFELDLLDMLKATPIIIFVLTNLSQSWDNLLSDPRLPVWIATLAGIVALSLLVLAFLTWRAARVLETTWQAGAMLGFWTRLRQHLCKPLFFQKFYRRWLQWSLSSNPVGWLERRTWASRSLKWGWLAVMCTFYAFILAEDSLIQHEFTQTQVLFASALVVSACYTAAASFRRERDNGVLALLLVSPLREKHIIGGRLRALWGHYIPALTLLFGAWLYLHKSQGTSRDPFWMGFFVISFVSIPVIGLYCSLWRPTFFGALLWTGLLALVLPFALAVLVVPAASGQPLIAFQLPATRPLLLLFAAVTQLCIAGAAGVLLHRKLSERAFTLPAT